MTLNANLHMKFSGLNVHVVFISLNFGPLSWGIHRGRQTCM